MPQQDLYQITTSTTTVISTNKEPDVSEYLCNNFYLLTASCLVRDHNCEESFTSLDVASKSKCCQMWVVSGLSVLLGD